MHVGPALEPEHEGFALIIFEERAVQTPAEAAQTFPSDQRDAARIQQLENEIDQSRQRLQAIVEEYETGQEEMKASNEEMQSTNEELRSTMEELETSKEELQNINEELQTVNQENRHKVEELGQLTNDLNNLLSATGFATLFLDRALHILRFTPKVSELFSARVTDRGRPISDLTHRLGYPELQSDAESVLRTLTPIEREVQDDERRWYLTRVLPYRSAEDRIEGMVVTFVDITRRVIAENALRESETRLSAELEAMQHLHDLVRRLQASRDLSTALADILDSAIGITGADMGNIQLLDPSSNTLEIAAQRGFAPSFLEHFRTVSSDTGSACGRALASGKRVVIEDVETDRQFEPHRMAASTAGYRAVQSTPLVGRDGRTIGVLSTHYAAVHSPSERDLRMLDLYARQAADFVESSRSDERLRESEECYQLLVANEGEYAIFMLDPQGRVVTWNSGAERIFGYTFKEIAGRDSSILFTAEDRAANVPQSELAAASGSGRASYERWQSRKGGSRFWASGSLESLHSADGSLRRFVKVVRDNSERIAAEDSLRALHIANEVLSRSNAQLKQLAIAAGHDLREPLRTVATSAQSLVQTGRKDHTSEADLAVKSILDANARMERRLNDLLAHTQCNLDPKP
jgi:PAS domain S-box-containing protein